MSNFLAPAMVTASLREMLEDGLGNDNIAVPDAIPMNPNARTVSIGRPDEQPGNNPPPQVNIFLYQVVPNAHWRNHDLPVRDPRGQLSQNPRAAIDLHYLITFFGDEATLEPQRLMGSVVHLLNDEPVLTPPRIQDRVESASGETVSPGPSRSIVP